MKTKCQHCGKEFRTYPSRIKKGQDKYCSKECYVATYSSRKKCVCAHCGKEYSVAASQQGDKYCSKECMEEHMYETGQWEKPKQLTCDHCGEKFVRYAGNIKEDRSNNYCSSQCYWDSMKIPEEEYRKNRLEYTRQYRKEHQDWYRAQKHKRRVATKNGGGSYTTKEWQDVVKKQNGKCAECGEKTELTVDHIIPVSKWEEWIGQHPEIAYGCNDIENIQALCLSCNSSKKDKLPTSKDIVRTA